MRYFPQRSPRKLDISLLLKVCSECLGDLVFCSSAGGDYYRCIQCNQRTARREGIGHLVEIPPQVATQPSDFFPAERPNSEALAS